MLNKKELVEAIAAESLVDEDQVREVLSGLIRVAERETRAGGGISLPGFGKLWAKVSPARRVRNPRTGEWKERGPDLTLRFQASAKMRRGLNAGGQD